MDQDARHPPPGFDAAGRLVAPRYNDLYFSIAGGLAETEHVFLRGNGLAERFATMPAGSRFTLGETGFGTGLNCLAACRLFDRHAPADATLRFVSVENHPLPPETIRRALSPWPALSSWLDRLLAVYQPPPPGVHQWVLDHGRVELVLLVGEADQVLADWQEPVDAWFLDGFAPARNPAMWSPSVFKHAARLSAPGATLATYTAAGFVRRGLAAAGFQVEKRPGFGTKREMTIGRYPPASSASAVTSGVHAGPDVIVIGAGLAGSFAARALAQRGRKVTVIDRQRMEPGGLAAMRPRVALLQPKISDAADPPGNLLRAGFETARRIVTEQLHADPRIGWQPCGAFHSAHDARREKRLKRFVEQFDPTGLCRWVERDQTESQTGLGLSHSGVLIDSAGLLRPGGLCETLLDHPAITVLGEQEVIGLQRDGSAWLVQRRDQPALRAERVVVANAMDALCLSPTAHLDLRPVRGQVSLITAGASGGGVALAGLRRILSFGGYLTPAVDGRHTLGASFIAGDSSTAWRDAEHAEVCERFARVEPALAKPIAEAHDSAGWAGVRCTTPTRMPHAGPVEKDGQALPGLYASLGHGSHGICSAAFSAERVADTLA
jgi:tRNA 5-methylaminomethyl-2-thiouridine biosynthesis bifunctional protein